MPERFADPTRRRRRRPPQCRPRERGRRRGVVMIVAVVVLVIGVALLTSFVALLVTGRASLDAEHQRLQARWLAESAIDRAAARLAADPKYSGERWTISAEQLAANEGGAADIRVEAVPDRPNARRVVVQADYPDHPTYRCRATREATVELRNPMPSPGEK
jgi:hypothetical protein